MKKTKIEVHVKSDTKIKQALAVVTVISCAAIIFSIASAVVPGAKIQKPQPDPDKDKILTSRDNCPNTYNPDQKNSDKDSFGNACDNCQTLANENQADDDKDGIGQACDLCPQYKTSDNTDADKNGKGDACEFWTRYYGGADGDAGYYVTTAKDSGYYAVGTKKLDSDPARFGWIIKTDTSGKKVWEQTYRHKWAPDVQAYNDEIKLIYFGNNLTFAAMTSQVVNSNSVKDNFLSLFSVGSDYVDHVIATNFQLTGFYQMTESNVIFVGLTQKDDGTITSKMLFTDQGSLMKELTLDFGNDQEFVQGFVMQGGTSNEGIAMGYSSKNNGQSEIGWSLVVNVQIPGIIGSPTYIDATKLENSSFTRLRSATIDYYGGSIPPLFVGEYKVANNWKTFLMMGDTYKTFDGEYQGNVYQRIPYQYPDGGYDRQYKWDMVGMNKTSGTGVDLYSINIIYDDHSNDPATFVTNEHTDNNGQKFAYTTPSINYTNEHNGSIVAGSYKDAQGKSYLMIGKLGLDLFTSPGTFEK